MVCVYFLFSTLIEATEAEQTIKLDAELAESAWIKFNAGQAGFFRVRYSQEMLDSLSKAIETLALPSVDRLAVQVAIAVDEFVSCLMYTYL